MATSKEVKNTKLWQDFETISAMYEMVTNKQIEYQPKTGIHLNSDQYWKPLYEMYLHNVDVGTALDNAASALRSALNNQ